MKVKIKTKGMKEIRQVLAMLPREIAGEHLREVALQGAEVIREEAVANAKAHKRTGTLADDIHAEVAQESLGTRVVVHVGPGKRGWYGRLVEFGHAVVPKGKSTEARKARKAGTLREQFGFVPPHPWLRPAFDAKRKEAQKTMEAEFRRRLERIWRKR